MTKPKGIRTAPTAQQSAAGFSYREIDDDTYEIVPARSEAEPAQGSDAALLKKGYVTLTLLSADRTINNDRAAVLNQIMGKLK